MIDTNLKSQAKKNIIFNIITFLITVIIGVWLPPYLISKLGVGTYGLVPISMSIISYMLIFTVSINGTISRFLALDFNSDKNNTSITFSTAFYAILFITIATLPLGIYFSLDISSFLSIPEGSITDASTMFLLVISSFFINSFSSLFNSIAYVKNRIDLRNISIIIVRLSLLIFLICFFASGYINLSSYGYAVIIATFLGCIYSFFIFKRLTPKTQISIHNFQFSHLKKLSKTGFWLIMDQIGVVLFLQTDILVLNYFKGSEVSGIYATLLQWSFMIRALISIFSGIVGPVILNLYANQNTEKLKSLIALSVKATGILTAITVFILSYFASDILRLWLGSPYESYKWVFITIIIHLSFNLSVGPLNTISLSYNKVKIPGILAMLTGFINIILGVVLLLYTDLNYYAIAIAGLVSLTIKNAVFTPLYNALIMKLPLSYFYKPMVPSIIIMIFTLSLSFFLPSDYLKIGGSYLKLLLYGILAFILISSVIFNLFLDRKERNLLLATIRSKFKN